MFVHDLTLLLAVAVVSLAGGVMLVWAARLNRHVEAVLALAGAYLLLALSASVAIWVPAEAVAARALIGNSAHLMAAGLMCVGLFGFFGRPTAPVWLVLVVVGAIVANAAFTLVYPDRDIRLALFNCCFGLLRLTTAWVLWRFAGGRERLLARGLGVVLLAEGLASLWRAASAVSGVVPLIGQDSLGSQGLAWVTLLISTSTSAPMLLLMAMSRVVGDHERASARLRNTLDALPDLVFEVGADGRYLSFHTSQPALLAVAPDTIIGRLPEDLVPPGVARVQRMAMSEVDLHGRSSGLQYSLELGESTRWFEISAAQREADVRGAHHGYVFVVRDVTERVQTQEALQYRTTLFNHLFERSPIALVLSRFQDRHIIEANPVFLQMLNTTPQQLMGRSTVEFIAPDHLGTFDSMRQELRQNGACGPSELSLIRDDGFAIPVRLSALALVDPQEQLLIWTIIEDLSERKRAERLKSEFLSTVSHELRTPLTSIIGSLDLLQIPRIVADPAQRDRMLDIARDNGQRLRILIDDLLDMDKLLEGKMRFELRSHQLVPLLESAIEANRTYGVHHRIVLHANADVQSVRANVDGERLIQVLGNLLSNAIKFSPAGAAIEVSIGRQGETARIAVRDHGPGVPESFRPFLFEKFTQAQSGDSRLKGGSGLGLAIVRELVRRMGGRVGYEPADGGGALFFFELPTSGEADASGVERDHGD